MKLSELDPHWLTYQARRVGFTFKCPHCENVYLTCFFEGFPVFEKAWRTDDEVSVRPGQYDLLSQVLPSCDAENAVPANPKARWVSTRDPQESTFETLTVSPSLDASASGHWHGWIKDGAVA